MRRLLSALVVVMSLAACGGETGIIISVTLDDSVTTAPDQLQFVFGVLDDEGRLYLRDDFEAEDRADVSGRDLVAEPYELLLRDHGAVRPSQILVAVFGRAGDQELGFAAITQPIGFVDGSTLRHTLTLSAPADGGYWSTSTGCLGWDQLTITSPTDLSCDGCDDVTGAGCGDQCVAASDCQNLLGAPACGGYECNRGYCDVVCADCADADRDGYGVGDGCAGLDCDDDDDLLYEGVSVDCYSGPLGTESIGTCRVGTQTCRDGSMSLCSGQVVPGGEACNGQDDDCDGTADNDLGDLVCGLGACQRAASACAGGKLGTCVPGAAALDDSSCDGIDSDCDGAIDEDCPCVLAGPGGDDSAAVGDGNVTAFATIQAAIDYAAGDASRPKVVCLAAGDCGDSYTFKGPVTMKDGIGVLGRFDLGRNRCGANTVTAIEPGRALGVIFPASVQNPTSLDGVRILRDESGATSVGVSLDGAKNVVLSEIEILDQPSSDFTWGVNLENEAEATITRSSIYGGDGSVETIGIRSLESTPRIVNNCADLFQGQCDTWCGIDSARAIRGRYDDGNGAVYAIRLIDSPRAQISTSAICGVKGDTGAAIFISGDAEGTVIQTSLVSAFGPRVSSSALRFESCGGASPRVVDNYSIDASGQLLSTVVEAIHAEGDCHPVIEHNRQIQGGNEGGTVASTGVFCGTDGGTASRCVLLDNESIRGAVANFPPQSVGVRCEHGGCMRIEGNGISGFQAVETYGLWLTHTAPLIANNTISGGCGTRSATGVRAESAAARLENNRIVAGTCSSGQVSNTTRYAAVHALHGASPNELDAHSNHIDGAGHVGACSSTGVLSDVDPAGTVASGGRGIYRNNIVFAGVCQTAYNVQESAAAADPRALEHNDLVPGGGSGAVLYLDEATRSLNAVAEINALVDLLSSGNISADPMQSGLRPQLAAGSPCVDAGTAVGAPAVDQDGDARDASPDIGPDER